MGFITVTDDYIQASLAWNDVYAFADANDITLPGGADYTVGAAGGYLQGGGHGILSNAYGLAVDRAVSLYIFVIRPVSLIICPVGIRGCDAKRSTLVRQ